MSKKAVLVTGAAGLIGSRFVEKMNQKHVPVISVDRLSYFDERKELTALGLDYGTRIDRDDFLKQMADGSFDASLISGIVHMGACTDTTELDEAYLKKINLEYSQAIWNFCAKNNITLVYASSAATYGDGEFGYDDDETQFSKLKPLNPYGESKRLFDIWAVAEEKRGNHPPAWSGFKFFNVYGFGERHKGKMASVILHAYDQIQKTGGMKLFRSHNPEYKDGEQMRDFVWVGDVIDVLDFALHKPIRRGIFNLGTGKARTFLDLVRAVFKNLGLPEKISFVDTPVEIRDRYQYFTEAKMDRLKEAGYTKDFSPLETGVKHYIEKFSKLSKI